MRSAWRALPLFIITTAFVLGLTACGISNPGYLAGGDSSTVSITLTGPGTVTLGAQSQYAAIVTGSSDATVNWSVNGIAGGNSAVGSISAAGLYSAPSTAPQSSAITITATSVANSSVSKSLPVALAAPQPPAGQGVSGVTLTLSGPTSVTLGTASPYVATITGTTNTTVNWSVNGIPGGDAVNGTISSAGLYTAPTTMPATSQVAISATSVADTSISQSMTVTLTALNTGGDQSGGGSTVELALSGATTVTLGASAQYTATVTGSSDTAVTWSVDEVAGGNNSIGTISASGYYTAPAKQPSTSAVTITATSAADPTISRSLVVALTEPSSSGGDGGGTISVALSGPTKVTLGTSEQYEATVTGSSNTAVAWRVNGVPGGNSSVGTISAGGNYTAPAKLPSSSAVTITATSVAETSVSRSLVVTLVATSDSGGSGSGSNITLSLSGATNVTLEASAQYTATVTGTSDTAVTWSINGVTGGDASIGTISTAGRYTAPATAPASSKVTVTAVSLADPSVSQSLVVTLASQAQPPATVALTLSGPTSVTLGTSSQYIATVTGTTNTSVTWTVNGVQGGDASVGTISATGRYTAPATAPASSKVTIAATSLADTTVSQSVTVTLVVPVPTVTLTLTGASSVTLGQTSQYTATVSGNSNTSVIWSVNGVSGGSAVSGSISASGLYTAPTTAPQPSTVTITATSAAVTTVAQSIVVSLVAPSSGSRIPSNAIASSDLDAASNWSWTHDPGTPGSSQGSSAYPVGGMSSDNVAREFYMTYSARGGEIYHLSFGRDSNARHFVYDAYVYVTDPSQLANLEMDMNYVLPNGQTVILGTQCSMYSSSWEYSLYSGGGFHWHPSNIPCNPTQWSAKTWHHIQIASEVNNSGIATYDWVNVDGQYSDFENASGADAESLGWALGDLLINFQIDGTSKSSGSNTLYTDKLIVWRW